jgi:ketosteroid isomerase-like protein
MVDPREDFEEFLRRREQAARAYVEGDPAPLGEVVARSLPATFFGPRGGYVDGTDEVWRTYEGDASAFDAGSETRFEILELAAGDEVAYWTGLQRATVRFRGNADPVPMDLRVTEVFRREDGRWRMVHRHADTHAEADG